MSFSDFNLNKDFIQAIEAAGYESPTDLQAQLIPLIEERKSALIWSQSASGKTGAFLIPAMNYILENPAPEKRGARILVLTSRRDRVSQINYTIKRLSTDLTMRFGFIVSGRPYQTQMRLMRRPLDIMIATPGRLNDLMNNGKADFSQLEMLVIDDLSSIYRKNLQGLIESILKQAGPDCSAITFVSDDEEVTPYAKNLFPNAEQITVNEFADDLEVEVVVSPETPTEPSLHINTEQQNISDDHSQNNNSEDKSPQEQALNKQAPQNNNKPQSKMIDIEKLMPQKVHIADDYTHKIAMMDHLMDEFAGASTIIYTATDKAAKSLQENLSNHGHDAELIDEVDKDELNEFDILIYSDQSKVDIDNELMANLGTHIINFDLPHNVDHYIDRLNRHDQERESPTLLILDGYNFNELKSLEKTFGDKLDQITIPGLEPLKPFVNLSRGRAKSTNTANKNRGKKPVHSNQKKRGASANKGSPANKGTSANRGRAANAGGRNNNNKGAQSKNAQGQDTATTKSNNPRKNPRKNNKTNGRAQNNNKPGQKEGDGTQRRQHKGPFGRLNGGTHRKSTNSRNRNVGVSRVGTDAPKGREGKSLAAEVKEKSADTGSKVKISYNKKRTLTMEKPEEL